MKRLKGYLSLVMVVSSVLQIGAQAQGELVFAEAQLSTRSTVLDVARISSIHGLKATSGTADSIDITEPALKQAPQKLSVFGYYRLFIYARNITEPYVDPSTGGSSLAPYEQVFSVGDGYREPMLSLNLVARPNGRSSFGTELYFFTPYFGTGPQENDFSVNLGINFYGNFRTTAGKFGIRAGGIHWYNLSPFTIGVYQILDRYSIFDRTPWEGVSNTAKYDSYYQTGLINVGDLRWNFQAFQGIILDGAKLPGNFNFDLFWGKMQLNGGLPNAQTDPYSTIQFPREAGNVPTYQGFAGDRRVLPSYIMGGNLEKEFGQRRNTVAYNTIFSYTSLDSINRDNWNFQVHTLSLNLDIADVLITGELGAGSFESPITDRKWGEALMLRAYLPEKYTFLPLDIQIYQISRDYFNPNGEIITNSNPEIQKNFEIQEPAGISAIGGLLTLVNQLQHNRRGVNINARYEVGGLKLALGWGLAAEIDILTSQLSYNHRINGLALSRIYLPFPEGAVNATVFGPYQRQYSFFRGVFERVQTTDLDPATAGPTTRKYYNAIDVQAKYKASLNERPVYLFYLGSFSSARSKAAAVPMLNDHSYLFAQYHELDVYYEILPKFILTGYFGLERILGGRFTEWGETQLPRDQTGLGFGAGFDWTIAKSTGLYFRYRRMNFKDRNFEFDQYKGNEYTIELKTFF